MSMICELYTRNHQKTHQKCNKDGAKKPPALSRGRRRCTVISYEGTTVSELVEDFHGAVDDYLELCSAEGKSPEKAFKGSFNVRFKDPELHKKAAVYAYNHSISLNSVVEESVAEYLMTRQ